MIKKHHLQRTMSIGLMASILLLVAQSVRATTFTVTNTLATGGGSLAQAIADANADGSATAVAPHIINITATGTVTLTGVLTITQHVRIEGPGQHLFFIDGGGAHQLFNITSGNSTIRNVTLQNASVTGNGGAINYSGTGTLTVDFCTLNANKASQFGGGIHLGNGTATLNRITLTNNEASAGGGMYVVAGTTLNITYGSISRGKATNGAGIYTLGTLNAENCSIFRHSDGSITNGSGVYADGTGTTTLKNCSIFGNTASNQGGGVYVINNQLLRVINCTLISNNGRATNGGGGIYHNSGVAPVLKNTIVYSNRSNSSATIDDIQFLNATVTGDANLVGVCQGNCGTGVIDFTTNPLLSSTGVNCENVVFFVPQAGSPTIDNGITDGDTPTTDICDKTWGTMDIGSAAASNLSSIFVKKDATGANNGTSWTDAFTSLQSALEVATFGAKIYVAKGTYLPSKQVDIDRSGSTTAREVTFQIPTGVEVYGGFAGNETINATTLAARDFVANETILSGDLSGNDAVTGVFPSLTYGNYADNAYHVVYTKNVDQTTILDGFTITGGNADGSNQNRYGAGWYNIAEGDNAASRLTIRNTRFYRNRISGTLAVGAGMYNEGLSNGTNTSLTLSDITFSQNVGAYTTASANIYGIGLYNSVSVYTGASPNVTNRTSNLNLTRVTFTQNQGTVTTGRVQGGGLFNATSGSGSRANITMNQTTFSENRISGESNCLGGGLFNNAEVGTTTLSFTRCNFIKNYCKVGVNQVAQGGAIWNQAQNNGGIANLILNHCTFSENQVEANYPRGGAIFQTASGPNAQALFIANNSIFYKNEVNAVAHPFASPQDGAIGLNTFNNTSNANATITNCSFIENTTAGTGASSGTPGGAVFYIQARNAGESANVTIRNSIIWGNRAQGTTSNFILNPNAGTPGSTNLTFEHTLAEDFTTSITVINGLANTNATTGNITGTDPLLTNTATGDLTLQATSPAIDQGNNSFDPGTEDLAGNLRIQNCRVDMGAYEVDNSTPRIYYVNRNATGANNGTSWADAFTDLQTALNNACNKTTIYVAKGTYIPTVQVDFDKSGGVDAREVTFQIPVGVTIYGGFVGNEASIDAATLAARDFTANETILSGDLSGNDAVTGTFPSLTYGNYTDNAHHVVYTKNVGTNTVLDGFTITGGNADGNNQNRYGAGWYNIAEGDNTTSSLTIRHTKFYRNRISGTIAAGAGMYNEGLSNGSITSLTLSEVTFSQNVGEYTAASSRIYGIGLYNSASAYGGTSTNVNSRTSLLSLNQVTFSQNQGTVTTGSVQGGGLFNAVNNSGSANVTMTQTTFSENRISGQFSCLGGGFFNNGDVGTTNLTLTQCSFIKNYVKGAVNQGAQGGGIWNRAQNRGGMADLTINRCIFSENYVEATYPSGGGIHNEAGGPNAQALLTINNSTFYKNELNSQNNAFASALGGAIRLETYSNTSIADATITNCSFIENITLGTGPTPDVSGGAVFYVQARNASESANVTIRNSIIWGNWAKGAISNFILNPSAGSPGSTNLTFEHTLSENFTTSIQVVNGTANTNATTGNITGTDPLLTNTATGDLTLQATSPAINQGNNTLIPSGITTDLANNARISGGTVDLGAYEFQEIPDINLKQGTSNIASGGTHDFGNVTIGTASPVTNFALENTGTASLVLNGTVGSLITLGGTNATEFTLVQTGITSPVAASGSQSFTVTFNPVSAGAKTATLTITSNDPDESPYTITLRGQGIAPDINVKQGTTNIASGGTYDFGSLDINTSSPVTSFILENVGTGTLTLTGTAGSLITLGGTHATEFTLAQTGITSPIAASGSQNFTVQFNPTSLGAKTATLMIASNDPDENPYTIMLTGTTPTPDINIRQGSTGIVSGGTYDFGTIAPNTSSPVTSFTLENVGTGTLILTGTAGSLITLGGTHATEFTLAQTGITSPIAASGSQTFTVQFNPTSEGSKTATLTIVSNDPDESPYTITLMGNSLLLIPDINLKQGSTDIASGGSYDFGDIAINSSSPETAFTIENVGTGTLTLSGTAGSLIALGGTDATEFSLVQNGTTSPIAASGSQTFTVTFNPTSVGAKTATLIITSDDPDEGTYILTLNGNGVNNSVNVPNLFTPNNDGNNDRFLIYASNLADVNLKIYDRQGQLVYSSNDLNEVTQTGWNGEANGNKLPNGTYVWQLSGTYRDGQKLTRKTGEIYLLR